MHTKTTVPLFLRVTYACGWIGVQWELEFDYVASFYIRITIVDQLGKLFYVVRYDMLHLTDVSCILPHSGDAQE